MANVFDLLNDLKRIMGNTQCYIHELEDKIEDYDFDPPDDNSDDAKPKKKKKAVLRTLPKFPESESKSPSSNAAQAGSSRNNDSYTENTFTSTNHNKRTEKILFCSLSSADEQIAIAKSKKKAMERSAKNLLEQVESFKRDEKSKETNISDNQEYPSLNEKGIHNLTTSTLMPSVQVKNICRDPITKSYIDEKCEQGNSLSDSSSKDNEDETFEVVDAIEQSEEEDPNSHNENSGSEYIEEEFMDMDEEQTKESDNKNCSYKKDVKPRSILIGDPNTSKLEHNIGFRSSQAKSEPGSSQVKSEGGNNKKEYSDEANAARKNPKGDSCSVSLIPEVPVLDSDDCPGRQSEKNVGKIEACAEFPKQNICASTSSKEPELGLTPQMKEVVENALHTGTPEDRLVKTATEYLLRKDIQTLDGLNWLNDKVINSYFELIMERSKKANYPSVHAFNTFFYKTFQTKGYSKVKRWTEKVDIFGFDLNFVPIHSEIHWSLAVIDHRSKKISFYDSMHQFGNEMKLLPEYICQEYKEKKSTSPINYTTEIIENIPLQDNGSDCGMFMLKYAEFISRDAKVTFDQEHMQYFRRIMIYELLTKQLL